MSVLVYIENTDGIFKKSAFEVVSFARKIADNLNTDLIALSIGKVVTEELQKIANYGPNKILNANHDILNKYINQSYSTVISAAAKKHNANTIILNSSFSGKELAGRIAIKLNAAIVNGVLELSKIDGNKLVVKNSTFSNKAFAITELTSENKVLTLSTNSYKAVEQNNGANIEDFNTDISESDLKVVVKEIIKSTNKISLPEAELVVSAGRGLKGPENWGIIEELANVLGAATACSKPVSDAGWRPHSEHVGQTGIAISPNLYIAVGISGAIQHLAGVSSSKVIVVINKDADAPFFKIADYGIVGDAFEVIPKLIEEIKNLKAST